MEFSRSLSAGPRAGRLVREAVSALGQELVPRLMDDARLVVTELVTNVVRHSGLRDGQIIELRGFMRRDLLRLELHYRAPPFVPAVRRPDFHREAGRGLFIVDRLTSRWGVRPNDGAVAWAEWDLAPAENGRSGLRVS